MHDHPMTPGGRLSAAIDILDTILTHHRPAADALTDWGRTHRFAGSGDRSAIGNLVFDALRRKLSTAARMGADTPRALVLGTAGAAWSLNAEALAAIVTGTAHDPAALTDIESAALASPLPADAPAQIRADIPDWLWPTLVASFGDEAVAEGEALSQRAPVDLRVNTLKSTREKVLKALEPFGAVATPHSPVGIRIAAPSGTGRTPNVQAEAGFQKGQFEVQDEGSQIAALIAAAAAGPSSQVLDLCAGGGGKTLALSAALANKGQIFAYDSDRVRLAPIHDRLQRAGARNVQVLNSRPAALEQLKGKMDCVVIDAPCTGTGVWRRRPESKWKLRPEALDKRITEQRALITQSLGLLKTGGRLVYITCSLLPAENEAQVAWALASHPGLQMLPIGPLVAKALGEGAAKLPATSGAGDSASGLTLRPSITHTDGFFVVVLTAV
jgi:16S rRNA (cytosine967-C5)-methyltransferase